MKIKWMWVLLFSGLLSACQLFVPSFAPTPTTAPALPQEMNAPYPLAAGAYWDYEGNVTSEAGEEAVRWRVEVVESFQREHVTGYLMHGSLYDLAFYTPSKLPSEYAILQVGDKFYQTDMAAYQRLKDEGDLLVDLVQDHNLILDFPLESGKHFCEAAQLTRLDASYCWIVGGPVPAALPAFPDLTGEAYPLWYSTLSDTTQETFLPGVGVVQFSYFHAGSVSQVEVSLVDYQIESESE